MKVQPICDKTFKALYKENTDYNETQLRAIKSVETMLDLQSAHGSSISHKNNLKNRGYDVLITQSETPDAISVFALKNFDFKEDYVIGKIYKLPVGDYRDYFDINDIYKTINKREKDEKSTNRFLMVAGPIFIAGVFAIMAWMITILEGKHTSTQKLQKATNELIDTIYKK